MTFVFQAGTADVQQEVHSQMLSVMVTLHKFAERMDQQAQRMELIVQDLVVQTGC